MSFTNPKPPAPPINLSARSPADLLSYVQHAIGFTPVESLVVMTTAQHRLGATLRVDLPPETTSDADAKAFALAVLSLLRGDVEADGVLLAIYTQDIWMQADAPPRSALVGVLQAVFRSAGLAVRSGWYVSASVWRDYFCMNEKCCPWPGHALNTVADSRVNAELVFGGSAFDESASAAVLRAAPDVSRDRLSGVISAEIEEAQAYYAAACANHWLEDRQFCATSDFWDAVLEHAASTTATSDPVSSAGSAQARNSGSILAVREGRFPLVADPDVAGFLLASLESKPTRDFLLASACLGSAAALEGSAALRTGQKVDDLSDGVFGRSPGVVLPAIADGMVLGRGCPADDVTDEPVRPKRRRGAEETRHVRGSAVGRFEEVLGGTYTGAPNWDRVDLMASLLAYLVSVAESTGEARASALTMLGWIEYARGRGSRAGIFLDAADRSLPGYRLARLLSELLSRGALPVWATARATAWTASTDGRERRAA